MLGLQTESGVGPVATPRLAYDGSVEPVTRVELDAGLGRVNVEDPTGCGFLDVGRVS